ncbi:hypothetical protein IKO50_04200 [bacterium]|nr:hypothetical protein [bacterium]
MYAATIATIPENNEAISVTIPPALDSSHNNPAIIHQTNAAIIVYQNQFFIPTILYIMYTLTIGIIANHPASHAFVKIFHIAIITRIPNTKATTNPAIHIPANIQIIHAVSSVVNPLNAF